MANKYIEYKFSVDGTTGTWHDVRVDDDFFRKQREVTETELETTYSIYTTPIQIRFDGADGYTPVKNKDYFDGISGEYITNIYYVHNTVPATPIGGSYINGVEVLPMGETESWRKTPWFISYDSNVYLSVCRYKENINGDWIKTAWSSPTLISGITQEAPAGSDGLKGSFRSFIFKNAVGTVSTPTTGSYHHTTGEQIPLGWTTSPEEKVDGETTWMSQTIYSHLGSLWSDPAWTIPTRFSGLDGRIPQLNQDYFNGRAGTYTSLIFKNGATAPSRPTGGDYEAEAEPAEIYPSGWADDPTTPSANNFIWVSRRKYVHDGSDWIGSVWTIPTRFSGEDGYTPLYGDDYTDGANGVFNSFVFFNKATPAPQIPSAGSYDGLNEVFPDNIATDTKWTDDPQEPAPGESIWVSIARYNHDRVTNTWSKLGWSIPTLFSTPTYSVLPINLYQQSATTLTASDVPVGGQYDFSTKLLTGVDDGTSLWTQTIPVPVEGEVTYISSGIANAVGLGIDDNIPWTEPVILVVSEQGRSLYEGALFQCASSPPTKPGDDIIHYNFATNSYTGGALGDWSETLPNGYMEGCDWYVTRCTFNSQSAVGEDTTSVWTTPVVVALDGISGVTPRSIFSYSLYLRSNTVPPTPTGGSFNFGTNSIGLPVGDWSAGVTGNPLFPTYVIHTVASVIGNTSVATGLVYSDPVVLIRPPVKTVDFNDGTSNAALSIYRRSNSDLTNEVPLSTGSTFNFTSLLLTPPTDWYSSVPGGSDPVYVSSGIASVLGIAGNSADIIWGSVQLLVSNGTNSTVPGDPGKSIYQGNLYQRGSSAPTKPTDNAVGFNFAANSYSGSTGDWTANIPTGTDPIYVTQATFSIEGSVATDNTSVWSTPVLFVENGETARSTYTYNVYRRGLSTANYSAPSGGSFNFSNDNITNPTSWFSVPPPGTLPLWVSIATASILGATGTDIPNYSTPVIFVENGEVGDSIEVQYSPDITAANFSAGFATNDLYMRQRVGTGGWSAPILIVGEKGDGGDYTDYQFTLSATQPTDDPDNPVDSTWTNSPSAATDTLFIWMIIGTKNYLGVIQGAGWSTPRRISGSKGETVAAKTLTLSATGSAFKYDKNGDLISDATITVTAATQGISTSLLWSNGGGGAVYTVSAASLGNNNSITVWCRSNDDNSIIDYFTIYKLVDGSDGSSPFQVILSNETHQIPTDKDGNNGVFTGSGTTVRLFEGTRALGYRVQFGAGEWRVTTTNSGVSHTTYGSGLAAGDLVLPVNDISSLSGDTGHRIFTITGLAFDGVTPISLTAQQSFSKSKQGLPSTEEGPRGSSQFYITGTSWTDSLALQAITNGGFDLKVYDRVTISSSVGPFSETKFWDGSFWQPVNTVIDGNLIVNGIGIFDEIGTNSVNVGSYVKINTDAYNEAFASSGVIKLYAQSNNTSNFAGIFSNPNGNALGVDGLLRVKKASGTALTVDGDVAITAGHTLTIGGVDISSGNGSNFLQGIVAGDGLTKTGTTSSPTINVDSTIMRTNGTANLSIANSAPSIKFTDWSTGADDFWIHINQGNFYVLTDREDDGSYGTPHPLQIRNATSDCLVYGSVVRTAANFGKTQIDALNVDAATLDGATKSSFMLESGSYNYGKLSANQSWTGTNIFTSTGYLAVGKTGETHKALMGVSTVNGEFLFGGSTTGGTAGMTNYLRLGAGNKLQYTSGGTNKTVYHSGNIPSYLLQSTAGQLYVPLTNVSVTTAASTVVKRDTSGDIHTRWLKSAYVNMSHGLSARTTDNIFYSGYDDYVRKNTATGFRTSLSVYSKTEADSRYATYSGIGTTFLPKTHDMSLTINGDATGTVTFTDMGSATLYLTVADDSHSHSQLFIPDTRGAARPPSYYPDRNVSYDFQNKNDTLAGDDAWHVLQTVAKWSSYNDSHSQQQIAYTGPQLKHREATSDSAWGTWKTIWDSNNFGKTQIDALNINADKLDGKHASEFLLDQVANIRYLRKDGSDTFTGTLNTTVGLGRLSHHTGHLIGSRNNVGVNSTKSNPIYTIGSNYNPNANDLSNMYGIGYSFGTASFLNSTDLGSDPAGWGMYVAADGEARIFLNASNGHGYFKGQLNAQTLAIRGNATVSGNDVYHTGNFGKTEIDALNIDADKLDGKDSSEFELRQQAAFTYVPLSNATADKVANTVVKRNGSSDINVRLLRSSYGNQSTISGAIAYRVNNGSDNYVRYCSSKPAIRTFLETYSKIESDARYATLSSLGTSFISPRVTVNASSANAYYNIVFDDNNSRLYRSSTNKVKYNPVSGEIYASSFKMSGGAGFYMADTTYIRATVGKKLYVNNTSNNAISTNGGITAREFISTSDIRVKQELQPILNASEKLRTLRTTTHERTDHEKVNGQYPRKASVIAQDVEAVLPEAISYTDDNKLGRIRNVSIPATVVLTIAAVNEHTDTIARQAETIALLEERLVRLEKLLSNK